MKNKMTLQEFADSCGGVKEAAAQVGVDQSTYSRWLTGISRPRGLAVAALKALGVVTR